MFVSSCLRSPLPIPAKILGNDRREFSPALRRDCADASGWQAGCRFSIAYRLRRTGPTLGLATRPFPDWALQQNHGDKNTTTEHHDPAEKAGEEQAEGFHYERSAIEGSRITQMGLQGREVIPGLGEIVARHAGKGPQNLACSYPAEGARPTHKSQIRTTPIRLAA